MKNTMIPVVAIATALSAEYGTIHVCALDEGSDVNTEHDFSRTSEVSGTQEDEMEYQKAKADAEKKQEYLNSVSGQYEQARLDSTSAKQVLDQECERVINDTQNELTEAEMSLEQAQKTEQQAKQALTDAKSYVNDAENQLKEAEETYQKLLDDLHIPFYAMEELNQQLEDTRKEYQDTLIEKNDTATAISSLKLELGNQYLNLTSLKTNRDLKQDSLSSVQRDFIEAQSVLDQCAAAISEFDSLNTDLDASIASYESEKESLNQQMNQYQDSLAVYESEKNVWMDVLEKGTVLGILYYNSCTEKWYTRNEVETYLASVNSAITKTTENLTQAQNEYGYKSSQLEKLYELRTNRSSLVSAKENAEKEVLRIQSEWNIANKEYDEAESAYQSLYQQLLSCSNLLDELEKKESECCNKMDSYSNDMNSIQEEIDALNHLKELCGFSTSRIASYSNDSRSYADLWKQILEAGKKKETAKEVLSDASEELAEKKKAEQVARESLKDAEKKTEKAKEKYESARAAVLEIRNNGKLTSEEFSYLNIFLVAYNNAVKNESQLRQSYEKAKLDYDIAAGLIAPGSELYNRHMKYIESLNAYEKLVTDSSDVPETGTRKPIENTSVTTENKKNSNEMIAGVILVSSLVFVTYSIMRVKHNRHDHA